MIKAPKIKITYNEAQQYDLEEFINSEYRLYCIDDGVPLSKDAIRLREAWLLIIDRLERHGLMVIKNVD